MRIKPTKKAKKVTVIYKTTEAYISEYTCPTCRVTFVNSGPDKNVIKFYCSCGQILEKD